MTLGERGPNFQNTGDIGMNVYLSDTGMCMYIYIYIYHMAGVPPLRAGRSGAPGRRRLHRPLPLLPAEPLGAQGEPLGWGAALLQMEPTIDS